MQARRYFHRAEADVNHGRYALIFVIIIMIIVMV